MKNLRNLQHTTFNLPTEQLPFSAAVWDDSNQEIICAFGPRESTAIIEIKRLVSIDGVQTLKSITSWDALCPLPDLACDRILLAHYFTDTGTLCLVLAGGDLVVVREDPLPGENQIEIVGSIDDGITAAAWSPEEEILAVCTRGNTLILMTRDFESLATADFTADDLQLSKNVSVGWGKKETQFQGKGAKALKDPTVPEKVDEGILSDKDDGSVSVTWRGDGAYVAVNSIHGDKRRVVRIFTRQGVLDSVAEPVDGLEAAISWRPAGNLIAAIQRLHDRVDVVFFERNGLRHGQFPLRVTSADRGTYDTCLKLAWNTDSSVLAVMFVDRVQFWTMGNYHWYLKQEVLFPHRSKQSGPSVDLEWHPSHPLQALCWTDASIRMLQHSFEVSKGSTVQPHDHGMVAVIDGNVLRITPLRHANVPPPMALHELEQPLQIIDIATNSFGTQMATLHYDRVRVFDISLAKLKRQEPRFARELRVDVIQRHTARQISYINADAIAVLQADDAKSGSRIIFLSTKTGDIIREVSDIPHHMRSMFNCVGDDALLALTDDGQIVSVGPLRDEVSDNGTRSLHTLARFPQATSTIEALYQHGKLVIFGLTDGGDLAACELGDDSLSSTQNPTSSHMILAKACTSFAVSTSHLIFSTAQHLLKLVHLQSFDDLEVPPDEPEKDERCRRLERGAEIVTLMPTICAVVLQMPRGNLETIYPRALVLSGIRKNIADKHYDVAFYACRNHRVDMNILYDYAPEQFFNNVGLFIDQLNSPEHVDMFLSQLKEEDVSRITYRDTLKQPELSPNPQIHGHTTIAHEQAKTSKVNGICDAFLDSLTKRTDNRVQNLITALLCKSPAAMADGIKLLADLQNRQSEHLGKAVEHICFLADVNHLYDCALGVYELGIALLVAENSQKDPREYLPDLQSLQEMEPLRRRFAIDDRLRHYEKALDHLYSLKDFDAVKDYCVKHSLYEHTLELFRYEPEQLRAVTASFADHLSSNNHFREAAVAYESLNDYTSAAIANRAAGLWRECLSNTQLDPSSSPSTTEQLARDLADSLTDSKDFASAAQIHLDYLSGLETAVRLFCRASLFPEAIRLCSLHARPDLLESAVDQELADAMSAATDLLADCKSQLQAQVPRIRELRKKRIEDPLGFYDIDPSSALAQDAAGGQDIPDNISLASTRASTAGNNTLMTRYTAFSGATHTLASGSLASRKTAKNRKREERKRARGKKGSVYEEEYLVASVGRLFKRVEDEGKDLGALVECLVRRRMRERARAVEGAWVEVVGLCESVRAEVWEVGDEDGGAGKEEKKEKVAAAEKEGEIVVGEDGRLLLDSLRRSQSAARAEDAPTVKRVERLRILA